MYFDESIKIDVNKLPSPLKGIYNDLLECCRTNDELKFVILQDEFETSAKQCQLSHRIDSKTMKDLFHKVGIY